MLHNVCNSELDDKYMNHAANRFYSPLKIRNEGKLILVFCLRNDYYLYVFSEGERIKLDKLAE